MGMVLGRFLRSALCYLGVVIGSATLFLIVTPLIGYLPYSDRPGPGWVGPPTGLTAGQVAAHVWEMLSFGLFFAVLFLIPAALVSVLVGLLMHYGARWLRAAQAAAGVVSALLSGYWMLGAGWYIAAGEALLAVAVIAGTATGVMLLPRIWRPTLGDHAPTPGPEAGV